MTTMINAQRDENRFTDADRKWMRARVTEVLKATLAAAETTAPGWTPTWSDVLAYERIAWHSLGCSVFDLRDSELAEIKCMVTDLLGLTDGHADP